jgi:hypothetical protein
MIDFICLYEIANHGNERVKRVSGIVSDDIEQVIEESRDLLIITFRLNMRNWCRRPERLPGGNEFFTSSAAFISFSRHFCRTPHGS